MASKKQAAEEEGEEEEEEQFVMDEETFNLCVQLSETNLDAVGSSTDTLSGIAKNLKTVAAAMMSQQKVIAEQ